MKRFLIVTLALLPLAGCDFWAQTPPVEEEAQESSRPETKNVVYRGRLLPLGASIYQEGTHRLELEDGRFVLLESDNLLLDEYLNRNVEVYGATRATVEAGGIIMRVENVAEFGVSSESVSSAAVSSEASSVPPASSVAPVVVSSRPAVASRAPAVSSAPIAPPPPVSSAPAPVASSSAPADETSVRAAAMARANMDAANWTQEYCSPAHLAFCFPVHKNWWYTSFGATSSSQWHVEVSSEALEALGDGPLSIVLVSGAAPGPDGQVTSDGTTVTGVRAWSGNRHFVISAPVVLEQAVRHITQELRAAPGTEQ